MRLFPGPKSSIRQEPSVVTQITGIYLISFFFVLKLECWPVRYMENRPKINNSFQNQNQNNSDNIFDGPNFLLTWWLKLEVF